MRLVEYTHRHSLERFKVIIEYDADIGAWTVSPIVWRATPLGSYRRKRDAWRALRNLKYHAIDGAQDIWQYAPDTSAISWPYAPDKSALTAD